MFCLYEEIQRTKTILEAVVAQEGNKVKIGDSPCMKMYFDTDTNILETTMAFLKTSDKLRLLMGRIDYGVATTKTKSLLEELDNILRCLTKFLIASIRTFRLK